MQWVTVLSIVFALIGGALLVAARKEFILKRLFVRRSAVASGTIIALTERQEAGEVSYFPKVRFLTPGGCEVTFQSEVGGSLQVNQLGRTVSVRYRPEQPFEAEINSFLALWGLALVLGLLGGVFFCAGLGIFLGLLPV